jgi:uncharacterized protein YndB with AHSA1/START domain
MLRLEVEVVINRPLEEVWAYVIDPDKIPEWDSAVLEAKASEVPLRKGSTVTMVGKFLGKRFETTLEITDLVPLKTYSVKATTPVPFEATNTFERVGGGTRIREAVQGETRGFFKIGDPIFMRILKRQSEGDFETLKELLEAQVPAQT